MYAKARKKVQSILAAPSKQPLPADVVGKLEDIMRRADQELA
jgi:trimethylamine:corrinoid methyltransferase-like protein